MAGIFAFDQVSIIHQQRLVNSRMWPGINSIGIIPENYWNWGQDYSASHAPF
jgi:hypothetical protein